MRRTGISGRAARAGALALAILALASCGRQSAVKAAEREKIAKARAEVSALEARLPGAGGQDRVSLLRDILAIEVMRTGELESALSRYTKDERLLAGDAMSRTYVAVALSMRAGEAAKIEDKLAWLMKGMRSFDELREEFPEDENVLLYQASTYANFPAEVGARDEVLDILAEMRGRYESGRWKLSEAVAAQVAYVHATLGTIYADKESAVLIRASRDAFAAAGSSAAGGAR